MAKTENAKTMTVYLDEDVQERLRIMADRIGLSRNRMALNLIIIGLDEAEFLREFVKLGAWSREITKKIRKKTAGRGPAGESTEVWEKPEKTEKTKTLTIYLGNDLIERLNKMTDTAGINRNRLVSNLLEIGLEEAEALWRVGIVQVAVFAKKLREKIRMRLGGPGKEE